MLWIIKYLYFLYCTFTSPTRGILWIVSTMHTDYADVWSAWAELFINVSITIVAGLKWGIIGILLGKIVSLLAIVVLWKPYYLFSAGFKESVSIYWKGVARNYSISIGTFLTATFLLRFIPFSPYESMSNWVIFAIIGMVIFLTINTTCTLLFAKGAKDSLYRIKIIKKK